MKNPTQAELNELVDALANTPRRPYTLKTVTDVPFGTYPEHLEGGPALVSLDGWNTSLTHGDGIDGFQVGAFKVISQSPWVTEEHELDGQVFPTNEEGQRAKYNAGLTAYMVYDDTVWASVGSWAIARTIGGSWVSGRVMGQATGHTSHGQLMKLAVDFLGEGSWTVTVVADTIERTATREAMWTPITVISGLYHRVADKGYLETLCKRTAGFLAHQQRAVPQSKLPEGSRCCALCATWLPEPDAAITSMTIMGQPVQPSLAEEIRKLSE